MHCSQFCGRAFRRKFNRDRHEAAHCSKRFDDEEGMTCFLNDEEQRTEKYYEDDDEETNSTEDGEEADDHEDEEEEGDGEEETDNDETGSDTENDEVDPWDKLREEAIIDLNSALEEEVQENLRQDLQKDGAETQASHRLLPVYRKKATTYLQYVRWYHDLKTYPVHKEVMKTLRNFMKDDEMDYTEALEAAISKQKYLLNSLFDLEHFPTEDLASTEDDDFTHEPMKRKY